MSVVLVGGNDRMVTRYKNICKDYDCKAKVFIKMPADFERKLGTPDLVIVFTNTVSHKTREWLMTSLPVTQKKLLKPYIVLLISSTLFLYSLTKLSGEIGHAYGAYLRTKVISS